MLFFLEAILSFPASQSARRMVQEEALLQLLLERLPLLVTVLAIAQL